MRDHKIPTTLGFLAAAIIEIVVFGVMVLNTTGLTTSKDWVTHTHIVLEKLHEVLDDLDDAALSQQGFLLTGNASNIATLSAATQATQRDTDDLRQLTADNPIQQRNLDGLTPEITSWIATLQQTINLQQAQGFNADTQSVRSIADKQALYTVQQQISLMEDEENRLLLVRDQQANNSTQAALLALAVGGILSVGLFVVVFRVLITHNAYLRLTEQTLAREHTTLRTLMDNVPDSIFLKDAQRRFITDNAAHRRASGKTRLDEVVGKTYGDLYPPELAAKYDADDQEIMRSGQPLLDHEEQTLDVAGQLRWNLTTKVPLYDTDGKFSGIVGIARDITERKNTEDTLRRSEERYGLLVERIEDYATYTIDPGGYVATWNPSIERLKGYSAADIVGQHISRFFPPEDVQAGKPQFLLDTAAAQGRAEDRGWRVRKDGSRFWANVIIIALHNPDGSLYGFTKITRDVTERVRAEERIQKLNRIYKILSDINQAIVRVRHMPEFFAAACAIAVEKGGFRMVWIGLLNDESGKLSIVAHAGESGDYLEKLDIDLSDSTRGSGPTGSSVADGVHIVCNDIEHDPRMAPWRENALRSGFRASAAFPLTIAGKVRGTFNLYASETGVFDDDELALLDELALDIGFAIEFAEQDGLRQEAQAGVRRYAKRLEILHEIDSAIIKSASIEAVVEATLYHIQRLIPCQRAHVAVIDQTSSELIYFELVLDGETKLSKGTQIPFTSTTFEVFDARRLRIIDDFRLIPDMHPQTRQLIREGMVSSLQVLLMGQEQPSGVLALWADTAGFFTAEHQEIAIQVANQLAIAIRQLQLSEQLTRRTDELERNVTDLKQAESALKRYAQRMEILHDIDSAIINATSMEAVVEATLKHIRRLIPCQRAHVVVIDQTLTEGLYFALALDGETELGKGTRVPLTPAIFEGFDERHLRVIDDLRPLQEAVPQAKQFVSEGLVSTLQTLLMAQEQPIGALSLWADTSGFFTAEHQEIAVQVANQLAVAIQQLRLSTALVQRAAELEQSLADLERAQEERRQSDARYRRILETAHEGIWLTDGTAKTQFANQAMADMLGYSTTEILDLPPMQLIHNPPQEPTESRIERRQQGISEQYDIQLRRKDGGTVWALVNASPIQDDQGHFSGTAITLANITERKQHETEIARKNRDLETLLYITSHDLREPLRAIRNFSQMVNDRYRDSLDPKGQDFLARIVRAGDRMDHLIEDILQLSRAQRQIAPAASLSGETLVTEALKPLDAKIQATNALITIDGPLPTFVVDRFWASQAVFNLVANALKFAKPNEKPQIEISAYIPPQDSLDGAGLVVRDRGIGLEPEQVERIFGLFQRAVGREVEGTGAGLAIVREIAERHGGRAWAQPRAGGGAEFFLTFGKKL